MGINCDSVFIFGVEFSYEEIQPWWNHPEVVKEFKNEEHYRDWCQYGGFEASPWFDSDSEYRKYYLGVQLNKVVSIDEIKDVLQKQDDIRKEIKDFCLKYDIIDKSDTLMFYSSPNI